MNSWDDLSIREKAEMMKVAIRNGITSLPDIKDAYNEFAGGGYLDWKEKASKYKHLDIDNDRTYDYEGWYNENPQRAWDFLNDSPDAHFDDRYKTVYHPTFSTQSRYSGIVDSDYNPQGLIGGTWNKQGTVFTMSPDGYRGPVSMDERKWYLENAEDNGVQLREADGSLPVFDGIPWGGVLSTVTVTGNKFAEGGNLLKKGGPKKTSVNPSAQRAMRYFMDKGLTDYQAAGLVGNLMRESGMDPEAVNSSSQAYGLAQWLGSRKKALFAKYGNHPTLDNQLDFIWSELNSTHRNGLKHIKASKSAEEAARNAMGYYEFSVGPAGAIANMKKYGQDGEGSMAKGITFASRLMGQPVPTSYSYSDPPQLPTTETIPQGDFSFTPMNPQVFGMQMPSYQSPVVVPEQPIIVMAEQPTPTPEQLERQRIMQEREEQRDALNRFGLLMSMSNPQQENDMMGAIGMLTGLRNGYRSGGDIHIKPSHRGRFTKLKERTGHSASWFKEHGTPAQKKMATFALNAAKWKHGYGGNLFSGITEPTQQMQTGKDYWAQLANKPTWLDTFITPLNGGQLSEVVVTPTNDESWLFSLGKYARNSRKPLADSYARKVVANYLSRFDNENAKDYNARISRLADTLDIRGVQFIKNNVESGKLKNRAHYDIKSNTAYIDDMHDIFAEIAHPWQDAMGNNIMNNEFKKGNYDPDIDSRGGTRYAYPDTFEGETHGFFQPALTEWVETGKIGRSLPLLNEDLSNEKIVPKDNIEVLDSAASWNKQAIDKRVIANPHQLPLTKRIQYSIWDYPLLDKRKAYGGNLYDGTSQPSQQMDNSYTYYKPLENIFVDSEGNLRDPEVPRARGSILLPEVTAAYPDLKDMAGRYNIASNDAIAVANGRPVNMHLRKAVDEGAKKYAARAQENPYLHMAEVAAGAIPLAIAAAPAVVGGGELAATALANPYVDAAITSAFAGHGLNHAINEGINGWGDAAMTALEIAPLGRLFKPAFEMGYSAAKPIFDKATTSLQNNYPALFDPYTSWDATLGYHGDNIFSRALGTFGRRHGYTPKAEVPEFHRRMDIMSSRNPSLDFNFTEDGNLILSSGRTGAGHDNIVNFATSEAARSHANHKLLSGIDDFIINSKAIGNADWKSIQPSDTFAEFSNGLSVNPKDVTFVSGNTELLERARNYGIKTLSSPRLRQLYIENNTPSAGIFSRAEKVGSQSGNIGDEMQRLTSMRGAPTMEDYSYFEGLTGLNSGVRPAEMWNGTKEQGLELFGNWGKPRRTPTFNHVAYAPASSIESIYRGAKTGERPWSDYYDALENMPSARQQLGLNSAMEYKAAPQITAENAASITPIPNNSSIRYAGSAKEDYSNSGYGLLDYLRNDKINAFLQGKPYYESDLGPLGVRREEFPADWTMTKMPFSNEVKEIINNSAKPRILAQAEKDIRDVYDPAIDGPDIEKYVKDELSYIEKQLDAKINEGYKLGSDALFKAFDEGKTATRTGGLQSTDNGRIVLREGENPEEFAVHEWEHRRTNGNIGGSHYGNEKRLLRKAFTKEFRELSETVPDFKGMNMDDEMVTTVSDTREALIGKTHLRKTAPDLQNKMIDKSSDEKVFAAVEKANAYGSFYIKKMRELGKLTPELAQNIREALKHVGAYTIPTAIAAGTLYGKQE